MPNETFHGSCSTKQPMVVTRPRPGAQHRIEINSLNPLI